VKKTKTTFYRGCQMLHFHTPNPNYVGHILGGLGMEKVGIFYDHLEYFTPYLYFMAIWYIFPVLVFWNKKNLAALFFTAGR
jgi:hypothetical protein